MSTHPVYLIAESGLPRDHHALFVETHEAGPSTGHIYHVKGNIQEGMIFEHRIAAEPPEELPGFCAKEKLGVVAVAEYGRVLGICEGVPVPKKQFQGAKRLYPLEPLRRCQEWVREATGALRGEGVLISEEPEVVIRNMSETPSKHATDNPSASSPERQNDPVQEGNEERSQGPQTETQTEIPDSMKESTREGEQKKGKEPEEHKENTEREEEQEEEGEASAPPLPDEILPPLPNEAPPSEDDGWEPVWDANVGAFYFYNRFTGMSQWDNPRVPEVAAEGPPGVEASASSSEKQAPPALGGYNPVIHGDYDPTAPYAQQYERPPNEEASAGLPVTDQYAALGQFNRFTGRWQAASQNPEQHNDQNKSYRQMNAFFDVDAAANSHDGRSLRAERSAKKLTKKELKMFKEKRREKKEEKRRAWLRD